VFLELSAIGKRVRPNHWGGNSSSGGRGRWWPGHLGRDDVFRFIESSWQDSRKRQTQDGGVWPLLHVKFGLADGLGKAAGWRASPALGVLAGLKPGAYVGMRSLEISTGALEKW